MIDFDDLDEVEGVISSDNCQSQELAEPAREEATPTSNREDRCKEDTNEVTAPLSVTENITDQSVPNAEREQKYWRVIHTPDASGLVVYEAESKSSHLLGRLPVGTIIKELQRSGNRIKYLTVPGFNGGPFTGWVNVKSSGPWGKDCLSCLGGNYCPSQQSPERTVHKQQALIVVDWDDTLFPTSWLEQRETEPVTHDRTIQEELAKHAKVVKEFLRVASCLGQIAIVTLAQRPWVENSIADFMPLLKDSISEIRVFYATEQPNHHVRPGAERDLCVARKRRTMEQVVTAMQVEPGGRTLWESLISIGDSDIEKRAAKDMGRDLQIKGILTWTKTVKLAEQPTLTQLTSQLQQLSHCLPEIVNHAGHKHLDLCDASI